MIVYIDDILLMGESPEHVESQLKDLLTGLGLSSTYQSRSQP